MTSGPHRYTADSSRTLPARRGAKRVLVLDNEVSIADVVARVLGDEFDVQGCTDAAAALDRIRQGHDFYVILCDLLMPGISGEAFFRKLESVAPEQARRVVFLTGAACLAETQGFLRTVPNTTLHKPCTRSALQGIVREIAWRHG